MVTASCLAPSINVSCTQACPVPLGASSHTLGISSGRTVPPEGIVAQAVRAVPAPRSQSARRTSSLAPAPTRPCQGSRGDQSSVSISAEEVAGFLGRISKSHWYPPINIARDRGLGWREMVVVLLSLWKRALEFNRALGSGREA